MNITAISLTVTLLSALDGGSAGLCGDSRSCGDSVEMALPGIFTTPAPESRKIMAKTNLIPWAATVMNVAGEMAVSERVSLNLPIWWCPWFISDRHAMRVLAFQPECRWWIKEAFRGHFIGPHVSVAWFNLRHGDYRYQDNGRPLLGGGITYGYMLNIGHSWRLEFSVGAGYASMRYDTFYNTDNGALRDTRQTSYWGIDHAGISIAYSFSL